MFLLVWKGFKLFSLLRKIILSVILKPAFRDKFFNFKENYLQKYLVRCWYDLN